MALADLVITNIHQLRILVETLNLLRNSNFPLNLPHHLRFLFFLVINILNLMNLIQLIIMLLGKPLLFLDYLKPFFLWLV